MWRASLVAVLCFAGTLGAQTAPSALGARGTTFDIQLGIGVMRFAGEPELSSDIESLHLGLGIERRISTSVAARAELLLHPALPSLGSFSTGLWDESAELALQRWGAAVHLRHYFARRWFVSAGLAIMHSGSCDIDIKSSVGSYLESCRGFQEIRVEPAASSRSGIVSIGFERDIAALSLRYDHGADPSFSVNGEPVRLRTVGVAVQLRTRGR